MKQDPEDAKTNFNRKILKYIINSIVGFNIILFNFMSIFLFKVNGDFN